MAYSDIYLAAFGTPKPDVPQPPHVDTSASAAQALKVDTESIPKLEEIAKQYNDFNAEELLKEINKVIPGYSEKQAAAGDVISEMLQGKAPGLDEYIARTSAETGAALGFTTSRTATTGFDVKTALMTRGLSAFNAWAASAVKPQLFDFSHFLLTPQQQIGIDQWNEEMRFGQQWLHNQIAAIPQGWQQALNQTLGYLENTAKDVGSKYLGGAGSSKDNIDNSAANYGSSFSGGGGGEFFGGTGGDTGALGGGGGDWMSGAGLDSLGMSGMTGAGMM